MLYKCWSHDHTALTLPCSANDSPFGLFSLSVEEDVVSADSSGSSITRTLAYTIERGLGQIGDVRVTVTVTYERVRTLVASLCKWVWFVLEWVWLVYVCL